MRYSLYRQSEQLDPGLLFCDPTIQTCASLAVRQSVIDGAALTSLVGYGLTYSTLDNARNPTHGLIVNVLQDFAGVGGDVDYVKSTFDASYYHEVFGEIVGLVRGQGGYITPWNGQQVRLLDNFFGGPNLVRGFAPNGFGPRDLTPGTTQDNVGGTVYWAVSAELQSPIPNLPKDIGLKAAVFFDAGSVFDYRSQIIFPALNNQSIQLADSRAVRSAVGAGLIWDSPFGPLRFDYAIATSKQSYDVIQQFRFGGGTKF